jgi:hypothetical protein
MIFVLVIISVVLATPAAAQVSRTPAAKPGSTAQTPPPKKPALSEEDGTKARAANEAREKAWDAKMKRTMGTICRGCER